MLSFIKYQRIPLLFVLLCLVFYTSFAYDLHRSDFPKLLTLYTALFFLSWKILQLNKGNIAFLFWASFLFRLVFIFSIPNLSQDFYRFLWDGSLSLEGHSPYLKTPKQWQGLNEGIENAENLIRGMGELSASNYTSYPPLNQLIFMISALSGSMFSGLLVMRLFIILADLGIFIIGRRILKSMGLQEDRIFLYLLNPLIIIETTGNLHFEGVMLCLLLLSLYLLQKKKWLVSSVAMAGSIALKLLPLLFLPIILKKMRPVVSMIFAGSVMLFFLLSFAGFWDHDLVGNFSASISLWFQKFEFNASILYVIRFIGYQIWGYNILIYSGPVLAVITFIGVISLSYFRKNRTLAEIILSMLYAVCLYYLLSSTVHPWYLATPLLLSIFTGHKFVLVWSYLIFLSYSAYSQIPVNENLILVGLEYLIVLGVFLYEVKRRNPREIPKKEIPEGSV